MSIHNTPGTHWDYAVEYTVELINHSAIHKLGWCTPYKMLYGDTPDISIFRFIFYESIYYLEQNIQFSNSNMLPGRFLGIAKTTGDTFTFIIETVGKIRNMALHQSVIRKRDPKSTDPYAEYNMDDPLTEAEYNGAPMVSQGITLSVKKDVMRDETHDEIILDEQLVEEPEERSCDVITYAGCKEYKEDNTKETYDPFDKI